MVVHQPEHRPQLDQRLAPGALDRADRLPCAGGVVIEQGVGELALDDHHRHPVGDHVVQLAGDPQALLLGALASGGETAQLEGAEVVGTAGHHHPHRPGAPEQQEHEGVVGEVLSHAEGGGHDQRDPGVPARAPGIRPNE